MPTIVTDRVKIPRYNMMKKKTVAKKSTVRALVKRVNAMRPEVKYIDQNLNFLLRTNIPATELQKLFDIPQNVTVNGRLGARIRTTSLQLRYELFNTGPQSQACFVRVVLLYDKNPNQAFALLDQIWDPVLGLPFTDVTLRNREFRQRFKIIYDKMLVVGDPGYNALNFVNALPAGANVPCLRNLKTFHKQNERIVYKEASPNGTIAETNQGAYYLATWCSIDNQCQGNFNMRLTYTDD